MASPPPAAEPPKARKEEPIAAPPPPPPAPVTPPPATPPAGTSGNKSKSKTTFDLGGLFKATPTAEEKPIPVKEEKNPVLIDELRKAWDEFAEQRKDQAAEYHILRREFEFDAPVISVHLTNPVEEHLLDTIRHDFLQHLREKLRNTDLTIQSVMKEQAGKKVIYTSREKFEHLAEKYPHLNDLKDRLGLDWDY